MARQEIEKGNESVPLSAAAITEFVRSWEGSKKLLQAAEVCGFTIYCDEDQEDGDGHEYVSNIYDTAVLGGISDLEGLRNAIESADLKYLSRIFELNKEDGSGGWEVTLHFVVLLMLIYNSRGRVTKEFLVARGFGEGIAQVVIDGLEDKEINRAKRRSH